MHESLNELISLMYVKQLDTRTFEGSSRDIGTGRVYGGQVLGQALKAAQLTVGEGKTVHSMHAYFMREGNHNIPITYHVDITRDGRSFSTRHVVAFQQNRPIFITDMSFQITETGMEYQPAMPIIKEPESYKSLTDYDTSGINKLSDKLQKLIKLSSPFEIKPIPPGDIPSDSSKQKFVWIKTRQKIIDDADIHRAILAYISDYGLVTTTLIPHDIDFETPTLQMASIDHGMWFHRPFKVDNWLLYAYEAISTSNSRGLAYGSIYDIQGKLIATTIQEGLIRQIKKGG
ncbi:MAG: acyl-CoA thioesterase-2 [Gammaproteobacteria bacterium]|jgi:acyl-CoA thioesterase-2